MRSGFDLLLQALSLPAGSEILFSADTIPDMVEIARTHVLMPIPVDVCDDDLHHDLGALRQAITGRSKVLVVAHLFGARPPADCWNRRCFSPVIPNWTTPASIG